jgi:uncharacterized protein YydD (DUF2326 family)
VIHRISSSLPSFKTLEFTAGLNVLLAQKSADSTAKQTRNRAGKTSVVEIVNFLTGSQAGKDSLLRTEALVNFSFAMEFDLGTSRVRVARTGANKSKVQISGLPETTGVTQLSNSEWINVLGRAMFGLENSDETEGKSPSFRMLFAYFVRRQLGGGYIAPEKQATMQQAGDFQMALMFLLGLDWEIARDWQAIRVREKTLEELRKAAGVGALGPIIGKAADLRTQLTVAEARHKRLAQELGRFQVLPEYHELEREASDLTAKLNELANGNTIDLATIAELHRALATESPPALDDIQLVYQEVGIILPDLVKKRYEDVETFHASVIRNRRDYLAGELEGAETRIAGRKQEQSRLDARRAEIMTILNSHGALDQFLKLQSEVSRLEAQVESLRQRFEAAEKLEGAKNELEIERNRLALRLRRDFAEQRERLAEAILAFEETSKRLYESAGSMLVEETSNGPMFQFPMQGSRSKGIRNMQIFCFDMMLMRLCAKRGIGPRFLIHDSHLFDGVDGRQVVSALRVGSETAQEVGFQYIVTMNEDDAFKETLAGFDVNDFVLPIRLTDSTEDGGLFGIRFD